MVEAIVRALIKNRIIAQDDYVVYQYGVSLLIKKIFHIATMVLFGFICGKFICTIVFLTAYAAIREQAGGYHAKTSKGCYLCTWIVTLFAILLFYVFEKIEITESFVILAVCALMISCLAPQETSNRPLDTQELILYRKKTRKYLIVEGIICLISLFFKAIVSGILCAWIVETIMLLIGREDIKSK